MAEGETLKLTVVAEDDASKVIEAVQTKVDKLEGTEADVAITADATQADRAVKDLIEDTEKLDRETATIVLAIAAGDVQRTLTETLSDIASLNAKGVNIDAKIEHANALKSDLDEIEAKILDLNATPVDIDTKASTDGLKHVGGEADNSRSVLANMVGNTTQEIGELGGVAGTAGVAIGQLGEYAAEGNISLSGLAKVAGPMAALSVVTFGLAQNQKKQAAAAKESAQAMEDLSRATDAQLIETFTKAITEAAIGGKNLDDVYKDMAESNIEGSKRLIEYADAHGIASDAIESLRVAVEAADRAAAQEAKTSEEFGRKQDEVVDAVDGATASIEDQTEALNEAKRAAQNLGGQYDELKGHLDFEQATLNFQTAFQNAQKSVAAGTALTKQDLLDLKREYLRIAEEIGLSPVQVKSDLDKIDKGEIDAVLFTTQQALDKNPVKMRVTVDAAEARARVAAIGQQTVNVGGTAAPSTVIVNVPRGYRELDAASAGHRIQRRSGRLYRGRAN